MDTPEQQDEQEQPAPAVNLGGISSEPEGDTGAIILEPAQDTAS